jgi:hypothetical protein
MSREEKDQSCVEFAANPVAGGHIWKDATSYSRNRERIPSVFTTAGSVRVDIVFGHIYYPEAWIMNCQSLGISTKRLNANTAGAAASEALEVCRNEVKKLHKFFNSIP